LDAQAFLKKLMNWRKTQPTIHHGKLMHFTPDRGTYTYFRYDQYKTIMVVMNKSRESVALDTQRFHEVLAAQSSGTDVISGKSFDLGHSLAVPARSVLILEVK
jgi:hypothetical protein